MKRICIVLTAEYALKAFLKEHIKLLSQHYDVYVVLNTQDKNLLKNLNLNANLIPLRIEREINIIADIKVLASLFWLFLTVRFDSVHSITPKAGLLTMLAAWLARIKIRIHTFQGEVWVTKRGLMRKLLVFLDKVIATISTNVIVVSHSENSFLVENKILKKNQGIVFHEGSISGVNLEKFRPCSKLFLSTRQNLGISEDDVVLLFLGRLNKDKGILDLVHAFKGITNHNAKLLFVGPDEHDLTPAIKEILNDKLHTLFFVPETLNPERYMVAADILCLPSYREGFPTVIIEAAACGVTALGSDIYGVNEAIVNHKTGLLHEPRNVNDITYKLNSLINNPELRKTLSESAYKRSIDSFDSNLLTQAWLDFYQKTIG
ncbi:glycosyltransferase [Methylophilus glucosoxydans]|uniref:Glycosyltransferase n=1 Tax=Methylophilus glucosoxydans TaxID=752553 RepID=A0ABW3GNP0_9PROT